ncbi:MAG TPA: toll/interleukin-1 receptor domain-containing protein, partial [Opitutaceae bacterium]
GEQDAEAVFDALQGAITRLVPGGTAGAPCAKAPLLGCALRRKPGCRSILVVVGEGQTPLAHHAIANWQASAGGPAVVVPVLPDGASLQNALGPQLGTVTALQHANAVKTVVPDILRVARVGGADFRVFISYRRDETQALAEQMFSELGAAGFRVFLDVSSGRPGRRFPEELVEELADKGLVLVLASPKLPCSHWTRFELAFARTARLGAVVLDLPGGRLPFRLPAAARISISAGDRAHPGAGPWQKSDTLGAPETIVEAIRDHYARQVVGRRLYLENALHAALSPHRLRATLDDRGVHHCQASAGKRRYVLFLVVVLGAIVAREFETGAGAIRLFVLPAEETAMGNDEAREALQESIKAQWLDGQTWVEKTLSLIRSEAATILAMGSGRHLTALLELDLNATAARACHLVSLRQGETPRRLQGWGELPDFNQGDGYYLDFELTFEGRVLRPSDDNDEARAVWTLAQSTRWRIATALAIERVIAAQIGEVETSAE